MSLSLNLMLFSVMHSLGMSWRVNKSPLTKILNDGSYSKSLVEESLDNFNNLYNKSENVKQFALGISNYAGYELNGNMVYDEILAEGIHDCYLHGEYSSKESLEIVKLLKKKPFPLERVGWGKWATTLL